MIKRLTTWLLAGRAQIFGLLSDVFESRAKALSLSLAFLLGIVLCVALDSNESLGPCEGTPRWLLVNVDSAVMVSNPDNGGFLDDFLSDMLGGILGNSDTELNELGLQMLDTCRISQIRVELTEESEVTVIDILPGAEVVYHELTVREPISAICKVLDCGDATRATASLPARPQLTS